MLEVRNVGYNYLREATIILYNLRYLLNSFGKMYFQDELKFYLISHIPHFKYTTRVFLTKKMDYSLCYC